MVNIHQRLWILTIGGVIIICGLIFRLFNLQIVRAGYYEAVAVSQRQRAAELAPNRGTIYVQENDNRELFPVAVNKKAWIAYAVPRNIDNPMWVAQQLAPALYKFRQRQQSRISDIIAETGQETTRADKQTDERADLDPETQIAAIREELYNKFNKHSDPYEPFLKFYEVIDEEFKQFIEEKKLDGIVLEETKTRAYPEETLAAHVLGYVGWHEDEKIGRYGVEGFDNDTLKGDLGFLSAEQDTRGQPIGVGRYEFRPAQDGSDIVLTIDRIVQSIIEDELKDGIRRYGAERGTIIVTNPQTGAVIGMATYPNYDPNYYYAIVEGSVLRNPAISEIFEPGSILKPLIMAAAINEGKVTPDTTMVDNGPVRVADYTIDTYDGRHHGVQTMTQILEQSNNVGMVWVGQQLGAETIYDYLRRFGLGEKTGIELEGETQNTLKEPDKWNITNIATTAFGQGVALTPLQAINAISAIANDGLLMQPYIVSQILHSNGEKELREAQPVQRVVSSETAQELTAMLVSVIENGVAQLARVPGYYLAGKTGTAQVPDEKGAYSPDKKIISFVGFGPITNPRFSVIIKLDNPSGLSFASGTAAPMFKHIAEKLLNYYQIPPDYDPAKQPPPSIK